MVEQKVLHTDAHVFFNNGADHNETVVTEFIITKLSLKSGLKKW